jgi:hypothetical protein
VFIAVLDGPDAASFEWLVESTASALGLPTGAVELRTLTGLRDRWAFQGEPAVEDRTRRNPRPTRWQRIDVGPDDQTIRVEFVHGIPDGLHHVESHEDDEEVRVTVFLGLNDDRAGGGFVLMGIRAWTTHMTAAPVGRRYINDGADT